MNKFLYPLLILVFAAPFCAAQSSIEGIVKTQSGAPLQGAEVSLMHAGVSTPIMKATTDAQGKFRFPSVEGGEYTVSTEAAGRFPSRYQLVLRPREPVSLTIELAAKTSPEVEVEVRAHALTIDPDKTGTSQTLTHQELELLPEPLVESTNALVSNFMPGASQSHDNFINVRGNEFSLHEFVNGVSFLDNTQPQFSPGVSPQIFETVDLMTGGFTPEFGNRFGGVLDITTRSGRSMNGHGSVNFRGATQDTYDLNAEYGGSKGRLGYYTFVDGFTSGRFLDPPEPVELNDFGGGLRGTAQLDWQGAKNSYKLLLMGSGADFQQPNLTEDQLAGRNASRRLKQQTAILTWNHTFSPDAVLTSSIYQRIGADNILPTSDPDTPLSIGSRSPLTVGVKSDLIRLWHGHVIKAGVDLVRLRELESFFIDGRGDAEIFNLDASGVFSFRGGVKGGQASLYLQDHFSPFRNLVVDFGARYDHFDLVDTAVQVSPRVGIAYHIEKTRSVVRASYNRLFSPPPIEYSLLASFIGNNAADLGQRVGNVRAYRQNYFEAGWQQELHPEISLEVDAYTFSGHDSFENHEIGISRLFLPINFHTARSSGADVILTVRNLERLGISGRLQYTLSRTYFYGPVSGGFTGDEPLDPGERIQPAFDQLHTGTANLFYRNRWRNSWFGTALRYGSGTIVERGPRLPQHLTTDLAAGLTVWNAESRRLDLQLDATNLMDNRYQIAKESEEIPIQFSPSRTLGGSLKFHF
ncbi:MAG TPA: TonB-dependent receptor [Candidatus Limnocylindrales bacterium]|nr:TonB-dependent receptor [Candidatus Limnocylindrales bacterium]